MIQITLRQVIPSAVYDGKVYTQTIIAEVGNETEISIDHPGTEFSEEDLGSTFVPEVYGQSGQEIGENNGERTDIAPSEGGSVNIWGRVEEKSPKERYPLCIDLGDDVGSVRVDAPKWEAVDPDDWVRIPGVILYYGVANHPVDR